MFVADHFHVSIEPYDINKQLYVHYYCYYYYNMPSIRSGRLNDAKKNGANGFNWAATTTAALQPPFVSLSFFFAFKFSNKFT